jgi:hypothetical protein
MKQYLTTKTISAFIAVIILFFGIIGFWWSFQPSTFDVKARAQQFASENNHQPVTGYTVTNTLIEVVDTMLSKSGGYISNDVTPPGIVMDNIPNWEFGVLQMSRDLADAMRKDFSRSQSQSLENPRLTQATPFLNNDSNRWLLPSAESQYQKAIEELRLYQSELGDITSTNSQFYARADNLRDWLKQVEKRLGSYSQRLSASVSSDVYNTDLAGDPAATQSTPNQNITKTQTSWFKLDDNFYEARGASWALLHFLKAVEVDFADVLAKKNASVSLRQIITELEATQSTIFSPLILNGDGFGMVANHSLVMANYISRANAALIELSELLNQG